MNEQKTIYGNSDDISIFESNSNEEIILENGKLLSNESYVEELLKLYDESFSRLPKNPVLEIGQSIKGEIAQINKESILLDLGSKEFAYISIEKDRLDPENYSIGQEIEALVTNTDNYLRASILEHVKTSLYNEMKDADNKKVYDAKVLNLTENGYILDIEGVDVFMPGSLGGINKLLNF